MTDSNDKCERSTALADATGSASEAIVYAGKHYGKKHRILFDTGNLLTLIHEPSGDTLTVHGCDVERVTPNGRNSATADAGQQMQTAAQSRPSLH